jgi:hypothetical protein
VGETESEPRLAALVSPGERALSGLLHQAHLAAPQDVPGLLDRHAAELGARDVVAYLADLQQNVLVPFLGAPGPGMTRQVEALEVDSTLAGRAFQHVEVLTQDIPGHGTRVWLPMLDGTERLGVLGVTIADQAALEDDDGLLRTRLLRYASLGADVVMTKTLYGDTIVRLRRRQDMGLAAEMQWGLLPPLTFASQQVTISGALEPAYEVAGDSVDYAVDPGYARLAVFDGMGHGLTSAHLAVLTVTAYRNARRAGKTLTETAAAIETAVTTVFRGEAFTTGLLVELDTQTGELHWINAGHPTPLLLRQGRLVKSLDLDPALPFGLGELGATSPGRLTVGSESLEPGDQVLLYTDGVVEARSPQGAFFGVQRLTDLIARHLASGLPTPEAMRRVVRSLLNHQQGQLTDDATMLLAEWRTDRPTDWLP